MDRPLYDAQFDKDYCDALGEIAFLEDQAEADREFGKLFRETACVTLMQDAKTGRWRANSHRDEWVYADDEFAALRALAAKIREARDVSE